MSTATNAKENITIQPNDPNWQRLQEADRRARLADLKVSRGKNGMPPAEATRLTVLQAQAYVDSALKDLELAIRSGKPTDVLTRRLEVHGAVQDLVEAARFEQVIQDLRAAMHAIEQRTTSATNQMQQEQGGSNAR